MNVRDIIRLHLHVQGLDGLYNADGDCACLSDDLSPADCLTEKCEAGHRVPCPPACGAHEWHIALDVQGNYEGSAK